MSSNFDPRPVKLSKKAATQTAVAKEEETKKAVGSEIGRKIVQARIKMQLKQKDLAMKTNLPLHVIAEWESGIAIYEKKIVKKIEKVLQIKLEW